MEVLYYDKETGKDPEAAKSNNHPEHEADQSRVQKIPEAELQREAYDFFLTDIADVDAYGYPLHDYELEGFLPFNEFIKTIYNDINAVFDYLYSGEFEQWIEYKFPLSSQAAIKDGWELSRHDGVFGYESTDGSGFVSLEDCEKRLSMAEQKNTELKEAMPLSMKDHMAAATVEANRRNTDSQLVTPTVKSHDYEL